MAYEIHLTELKNFLPGAKNILIALPPEASIDKLAAGLSLLLSLSQAGKSVAIVSDSTIRVSDSHLFGIDHVQKNIPQVGNGGNLTITLEGVASADNTIPSLEKLDWYAENNNLNLVFHVVPGQTFNPSRITPRSQGSGFDLIFVIGSPSLDNLGNVYRQNSQAFQGHIVNIDNQGSNTGFGATNVVDQNAASVSEMVANLFPTLGLPLDGDIASNLVAGIFEETRNLTSPEISAETFMAVANLLRAGGKKPATASQSVNTQPVPQPPQQQQQPSMQPPPSGLDLSALIPKASQPTPPQAQQPPRQPDISEDFVNPSIVSGNQNMPSPEERPAGERVVGESEAEPDWLTPKIFKGGQG